MVKGFVWFLTFVVGLVVGIVVSPVLLGDLGAPAVSPGSKGAVAPSPVVEREPVARQRPRAAPAPAPARVADPADAEGEELLSRALRVLPAPERATGTGTITGTVMTQSAVPIPGVTIVAFGEQIEKERDHGRRRYDPTAEPDLLDLVRDVIQTQRRRHQNRFETASGADGSFALEGLSDACTYEVHAKLEGYEFDAAFRGYRRQRVGAELHFTGQMLARLPLRVERPDGTEPEHARLTIELGDGSRTTEYWSLEEPELELKPGKLSLRAAVEEEELASDDVDVQLDAAAPHPGLTLFLRAMRGIKGRVTLGSGMQDDWLRVTARKTRRGKIQDEWSAFNDRDEGRVAPDGTYTISDLEPGTYQVGVSASGRQDIASATIEVTDGMVVHDFTVEPPAPDEYVIVWIYDPAGELTTNANISTGWRSEGSSSSGGGRSTKLPDGSFRVLHHSRGGRDGENDEEGTYFITVSTPECGSKEVSYQRAPGLELSVHLEAPARLTATVLGYAGSQWEDSLRLSLEEKSEESDEDPWFPHMGFGGGFGREGLDESGVQEFGPVSPGAYILFVSGMEEDHGSRVLAKHDVHLIAGDNQLAVPLPVVFSVTVVAPDLDEGTGMSLNRENDWSGHQGQLDASRQVVFENVAPGDYTIYAQTAEGQSMQVTVNGSVVIAFAPQVMNAMEVTISDPAGYLATSGLRTGDVIVGVNDEMLEDLLQYQAAMLTAASEESSLELMVLRGGAILQVEVDGKKLTDWAGLGGQLQPSSH